MSTSTTSRRRHVKSKLASHPDSSHPASQMDKTRGWTTIHHHSFPLHVQRIHTARTTGIDGRIEDGTRQTERFALLCRFLLLFFTSCSLFWFLVPSGPLFLSNLLFCHKQSLSLTGVIHFHFHVDPRLGRAAVGVLVRKMILSMS